MTELPSAGIVIAMAKGRYATDLSYCQSVNVVDRHQSV